MFFVHQDRQNSLKNKKTQENPRHDQKLRNAKTKTLPIRKQNSLQEEFNLPGKESSRELAGIYALAVLENLNYNITVEG